MKRISLICALLAVLVCSACARVYHDPVDAYSAFWECVGKGDCQEAATFFRDSGQDIQEYLRSNAVPLSRQYSFEITEVERTEDGCCAFLTVDMVSRSDGSRRPRPGKVEMVRTDRGWKFADLDF